MDKYLNTEGLTSLIRKFKSNFVQKETGKGLSTNDYTDKDKGRVAAIDKLTAEHGNIEIYHYLGQYPQVDIVYWEYGLGTVPLEQTPAGVSWDGTAPETIPVKVIHPSRRRMQIQVPIDYVMTNPTIKKMENNEYVLTEGIKSMQILIGVI